MAALAIRPFRPGDEFGLCAAHERSIRILCARDYTPAQIAAWMSGMTPERYLRSMAEHGERFWVAEDAGRIAGFAGWHGDHIRGFYMDPDYAGQGWGRCLFSAIEAEFWRLGGAPHCLIDSTITARPFYERMGFAVVAPRVHPLRDGTTLDAWRMRKVRPA